MTTSIEQASDELLDDFRKKVTDDIEGESIYLISSQCEVSERSLKRFTTEGGGITLKTALRLSVTLGIPLA